MNNDLQSIDRFNLKLNEALVLLAAKWGVSADTDRRIADVRNSADLLILGRTRMTLLRMKNGSSFSEHAAYFQGLMDTDFKVRLTGYGIPEDTTEHKQALKLLKDLAHTVGHTITHEQEALARVYNTQRPRWMSNGLIPTDHIIDAVPPTKDITGDMAGWDSTIPAGIVLDEGAELSEEQRRITEIIKGASPSDLHTYITTTLRPRFMEVRQELKNRRALYKDETGFQMIEGALIDFSEAMDGLMLDALRKAKSVAPPPVPDIHPDQLDAQLKALQSRIDGYIDRLNGPSLKEFYQNHLKPKYAALVEDIFSVSTAGNDPVLLDAKEKHLAVIQTGMSAVLHKMNAELNNEIAARAPQKTPAPHIADYPVVTNIATPAEVAAFHKAKATREDAVPAVAANQVIPPEPTSRDISDAVPLPFTETPKNATKVKAQEGFFKKHWNKAVSAVVGLTAAFAFSTAGAPQAPQTPTAAALPATTVITARDASSAITPPEATAIIVAQAANDVTDIAPVAATAPKTVKATSQTVKRHFVPAVEPVIDVKDDRLLIEKSFDIADFRMDLSTLVKACQHVGATNPEGVCASFSPAAPEVK